MGVLRPGSLVYLDWVVEVVPDVEAHLVKERLEAMKPGSQGSAKLAFVMGRTMRLLYELLYLIQAIKYYKYSQGQYMP